ncbi:hypothetical protein ACFZAU_11685 [Streptomyces sp. NPDC008238]
MREAESEEEWELSVLLERVVPRTPAPQDRMTQIRRRVRRRRRRRVAAGAVAVLGGATAAAVVAAALLGPADPVAPRGQRILPAASPTRSAGPGPTSAPTPTPALDAGAAGGAAAGGTDSVYAYVTLDALSGLGLKLPGTGWRSLVTAAPDGLVVGFVGAQPLRERDGCTKSEMVAYSACPPVDAVAEGGVLIAFRQMEAPASSKFGPGRFVVKGLTEASGGCRALGGRNELTAWGEDPDATSSVGLMVRACFSRPTKGAVDAVVASLRGASYAAPSR